MFENMAGFEGEGHRSWDMFLDGTITQNPSNAEIVLIPVPYDSTTSYKTGARDGPKAIIAASKQLEDYDLELNRDVSKVGIYTTPEIEVDASGPEAMIERIKGVVDSVGKKPIIGLLGGEHTVTIGAIYALRQRCSDLTVLYLDAHADLRDEYMGTRWGHASVARRINEVCPVTLVGVRSLSVGERHFIEEAEVPTIFWPPGSGNIDDVLNHVLDSLSGNVYISIDLDVFDPSIMAAVGTPEPGGMTWADVTGLVRGVAEQRSVLGFDLVELSPSEGPEASAFTAAKLAYKMIGYVTA
jgi:agmatinase